MGTTPPGYPPPPGQPPPSPPQPATEHPPTVPRKGKYALSAPSGAHDWWQINDMERMYAVFSIQVGFPDAVDIAHFAWGKIPASERKS
jgi:hypothetical protein